MMFSKKKEPIIYCYGCGCLLHHASKKIPTIGYSSSGPRYFNPVNNIRNYCNKCAPSYDKIYCEVNLKDTFWETTEHYYKIQPDVEVTEEGKPVKK